MRTSQLVQTIDLPATLLEYFGQPLFSDMEGRSLRPVLEKDEPVRNAALFGIFGGQVCCTDGKWVYMRSPLPENQPRYEYTLMPTRHGGRRAFINNDVLQTMELNQPFSFTKGIPAETGKHKSGFSGWLSNDAVSSGNRSKRGTSVKQSGRRTEDDGSYEKNDDRKRLPQRAVCKNGIVASVHGC